MYTVPPKKMLILNILDILKKYTDENHRLSAKEIGDILEREYEQVVDRKAIKRNLMNLLDFGYDIEYTETVRTSKSGEEESLCSDWYLNREFTDPELRLLIDSLLFSKTIPYNRCKDLTEKLKGLSNTYFSSKVRHIRSLPEDRLQNKELFYTIDILDEAIEAGKMVAFRYNEYDVDKKQHPRKDKSGDAADHIVSPYQMAATNGWYYLICNRKHFDDLSNYRVDRISGIRILDEPAAPMRSIKGLEHGLDLPKHMAENIYMFGGDSIKVVFRAKRYIVGDILDWFGGDVAFTDVTETEVTATVQVNELAMFYWAMQYGEHVEVIEPPELRDKVLAAAKSIVTKYSRIWRV